jgi:hypothetical protein
VPVKMRRKREARKRLRQPKLEMSFPWLPREQILEKGEMHGCLNPPCSNSW